MKFSELSALSDEQLVHREVQLERSMLANLFRHRLGKLENTGVLGIDRRNIARAQTALTSRESAGGLAKGSLKARYMRSFVAEVAAPASSESNSFLSGMLDTNKDAE